MATTDDFAGDQRMRLANQYETFLRSMMMLRGDSLSTDQLGQIVDRAVASASPEERRNPVPSPDAINRLQQFLIQTTETGRPRNDFSADAARAAQAKGGSEHSRSGAGFGTIDAIRANSSARFREMASDSAKGTSGSGASGNGNPITPEFARSFAGTGMVGGTLRTFAEVGLDRGTFNEFRREGFSKAQIIDSANDSKALGWKGKEDLSIAQHASPETRKSFIAVEQAKTPEQIAAAQAREAAEKRRIDALPEGDPRKTDAQHFYRRAIETSKHRERHQAIGTGARQNDATVAQDHAGKTKAPDQAAQDGTMAKGASAVVKNASIAAKRLDSGFEVEAETPAAPSPNKSKPAPVRTASAKPAAPTVG